MAVIGEAGGCMAPGDLAAHTSTWVEPISTTYRGLRVWECPPNGQGLAALLALNILEGFDLGTLPALSAARLHLEIEAMRLAFADARRYVADPAVSPAPLAGLLDQRLRRRAPEIDPARARQPAHQPRHAAGQQRHGVPQRGGWRGQRLLVHQQQLHGLWHGHRAARVGLYACKTAGTTSAWTPPTPTRWRPASAPTTPSSRPWQPTANDDRLYASFGVMGGFMQPQGHMQVVVGLADDGLDPQAALDRPRFCIEPDEVRSTTALEEGIPVGVMAQLAEMGHTVTPVSGMGRSLFGRGQIIRRDPETRRVVRRERPARGRLRDGAVLDQKKISPWSFVPGRSIVSDRSPEIQCV